MKTRTETVIVVAPEARIDVVELQRLLQEIDRSVLLVEPRILRRVIKRHLDLPGLGLQVPHRKSIVLSRQAALTHASAWELGVDDAGELPEELILITRPDADRLTTMARAEALTKYWRLYFHACIHRALESARRQGKLTSETIGQRILAIGSAEFNEIRQVLSQESYLPVPASDDEVYVEFSAVYWELHFFASYFLPAYFPGLGDHNRVEEALKRDLDAVPLLHATRVPGAPDLASHEPFEANHRSDAALQPVLPESAPAPEPEIRAMLVRRASRARSRGNVVRAAILNTRAGARAKGADKETLAIAVKNDLDRLSTRLQRALTLAKGEARRWREALAPLVLGAARGIWPIEARLLYDLQKVCIDSERKVHTVDVMGWLASFGRRRIVRLLPHHQEVMLLKHLRRAAHRTSAIRVNEEERRTLAQLIDQSIVQAENRLREQVRPLILESLRKAGMAPGNYPEKIALDKLVQELLDFVVERGYLNMGDLRDAISRNNLKLSDLDSMDDLVRGDLLLRSSRRLRTTLDGVYHHGEFYLRWMQRLSSIAFGTELGRFLTLYVALPFGGSYVILHGLHHIVFLITRLFSNVEIPHTNDWSILLFGIFLFALINFKEVRQRVIHFLFAAGGLVRMLFIGLPVWCFHLPVMRRILGSRLFGLCRDFVIKPMTMSAVVVPLMLLYGFKVRTTLLTLGVTFFSLSILLNTFLGRHVEEALTDAVARIWRRLHLDVVPAILRFVLDLFRQMIEGIERCLYTVDEWLRFRTGESRVTLVMKGALGLIWFVVTYVVRIYVNLLIEPTVNPIKHFPVVTVAAKLILPFAPLLLHYMAVPFQPLGQPVAYGIAFTNFILIPGAFGFLLWELKENWRLYEANRPPALQTVPIGHHGETMVRLLRPGFHSGTIPKAFARLRRALRGTSKADAWKAVHRQEETLQHVADRLHKFADREFVALLNGSQYGSEFHVRLDRVGVATNRIVFEFANEAAAQGSLVVALEEQAGWIVASILESDWVDSLAHGPAEAVQQALLGLYKLAGVDLLQKDLANLVEPISGRYELGERQIKFFLVSGGVVSGKGSDHRSSTFDFRPSTEGRSSKIEDRASSCIVLELHEGQLRLGSQGPNSFARQAIGSAAPRLLFSNVPILWKSWVEAWQELAEPLSPETPILSTEEVA